MRVLIKCVIRILISYIFLIYQPCFSWEAEDYELFDLVEEVNKNFYDTLNVTQDASSSEIRKAYHRLSLKLHPDHNDDPEADKQFRLLVGIYDVLKDEVKRQKYDQVLKVGLPNWKSPLYYYRKVRKLGLLEITAILVAIFTLGHYIVLWSVYLERRYEIEEVLSSKLKRRDRKSKRGKQVTDNTCELITEQINELPKPSFRGLLPFLIIGGIKSLITRIPSFLEVLKSKFVRNQLEESDLKEDDEGESNSQEDTLRKTRRKRILEIPEYSAALSAFVKECDPVNKSESEVETLNVESDHSSNELGVKVWSDKDIAALTKVMVRYPSGTPGRWEKIAIDLQRNVKDVTEMVKSLRSNSERKHISANLQGLTANSLSNTFQIPEETTRDDTLLTDNINPAISDEQTDSTKRLPNDSVTNQPSMDESWSQVQQKSLEQAIIKFPRGVEERWERVAECVPNKSKDECFQRYKYLVEKVKMKRQK